MSIKSILILFVSVTSTAAMASDHWFYCSDAGQAVAVDNGELTMNGEPKEYTVVNKTVVKNEEEKCVLKESGQTVISLSNEVSVREIEINNGSEKVKSYILCEEGGSGIPANESCKE